MPLPHLNQGEGAAPGEPWDKTVHFSHPPSPRLTQHSSARGVLTSATPSRRPPGREASGNYLGVGSSLDLSSSVGVGFLVRPDKISRRVRFADSISSAAPFRNSA